MGLPVSEWRDLEELQSDRNENLAGLRVKGKPARLRGDAKLTY